MLSNVNALTDTFAKMTSDGWDPRKPLKWGFYFVDANKEHLQEVYSELSDHNYKLENLEKTDDGLWQLFVTKVEVLTPDKLHKRNVAFNELAIACDVELYDGWDVEQVQ